MEPKHTTHLNWDIDNDAFLNMTKWPQREPEEQYQIVPASARCANGDEEGSGRRYWRVILTPVGVTGRPMPLEIRGDVVIGSHRESNDRLDVNICAWRGYDHGVSRRHIMLRPSRHKLFVMDLRSTNGTHINGLPLGVGWAYALKDGDLMTLGRLHIRVRIVQEASNGTPEK